MTGEIVDYQDNEDMGQSDEDALHAAYSDHFGLANSDLDERQMRESMQFEIFDFTQPDDDIDMYRSTIREALDVWSDEAMDQFYNNNGVSPQSPSDNHFPNNPISPTPAEPIVRVTQEEMQPLLTPETGDLASNRPANEFDIIVEQNTSSSQTHLTTTFSDSTERYMRRNRLRHEDMMDQVQRRELRRRRHPQPVVSPVRSNNLTYTTIENQRSTGTSTLQLPSRQPYINEYFMDANGEPTARGGMRPHVGPRAPDSFPHLKEDPLAGGSAEDFDTLMLGRDHLDSNGNLKGIYALDDDEDIFDSGSPIWCEVGR